MKEKYEDVYLAFQLFEFSIRTMSYAELEEIDTEIFGRELHLNLQRENVVYSNDTFKSKDEIIKFSQMAVGSAFGATAICLDVLLENIEPKNSIMSDLKDLISAVRNAFSHGIANPIWYVKKHKLKVIDLSLFNGPIVDLASLNNQPFEYLQIGGLATWYKIKNYVISNT